jgi:hypothetical protein
MQMYLVDAKTLRLPRGFEPLTVAGRAVGVLGLIQYVAPSPLVYNELTWMPCLVKAAGRGRSVRGYFVDKMYVDSEASLAGGREMWRLPKQLARIEVSDREAVIDTEDGAHLRLDLLRRGPAPRTRLGTTTVQDGGTELVRFKGSGAGLLSSGGIKVRDDRGAEAWTGWRSSRRLPGVGFSLRDFEITMHAPQRVARA